MELTKSSFRTSVLLLCLLSYKQNDEQCRVTAHPRDSVIVTNFVNITLDCYEENYIPSSKSHWNINNKTIIIGEDFTVMIPPNKMKLLNNYSLLLRNVTQEDEGWYQCFDGNEIVREHEVQVSVHRNSIGGDSYTSQVMAVETMTNISFHCAVKISKNVKWTFNNLTITIGEEFVRKHSEGKLRLMKNYTLVIAHANNIDEGWYRCVDKKEIIKEYQLQILGVEVNDPFCKSVTIERKLTAKLPCNADNVGNYQWMMNNVTLVIGENFVQRFPDGKFHVTENYTLEIRNSDISDEGIYRCMEKNRLVSEYQLEITVLPQITILHEGRQLLFENRFVVGKPLRLTCLAKSARPSASLMWSNIRIEQSKVLQNTTIKESSELIGTHDSWIDLLFTPNEDTEEITCVNNGTNSQQSVTVFITGFLEDFVKFDFIYIAMLGAGALVLILGTSFIIRGLKRTMSGRDIERAKTFETRNAFNLDKLHPIVPSKSDEDEVYYSSIKENIRGACIVQMSDIKFGPILNEGLLLERWIGKLNLSQKEQKNIVISSLSDRGNLYGVESFGWISHIEKIAALEENMFIVKMEGLFFDRGNIYLLQEYLAAGNLEEFLLKEKCCKQNSLAMKMRLVLDVILGIEFLHSKTLFHPGLSTRKILLTEDSRCKLYDFYSKDYVLRKVSIMKLQV